MSHSAIDLHDVFNLIDRARHLADVSKSRLDASPDAPFKGVYLDSSAGRAKHATGVHFGFLLPHGIQLEGSAIFLQNLHEGFYTHLNDLDIAYERSLRHSEGEMAVHD